MAMGWPVSTRRLGIIPSHPQWPEVLQRALHRHIADPTRARQTATRRLGGYSLEMSRQRGTCGSGTSAPSLAGQVSLPPRVEHQQGPEDLLMVPRARDMLSDEPGCRTRIEESDASDLLRIQACLEHAAQRAAHP